MNDDDYIAPFYIEKGSDAWRENLKQYKHFPIREWLQHDDKLLNREWVPIPRTYEYDPVRGFSNRYRKVSGRDGFFRFRSTSRQSRFRTTPTGEPVTLWRAEVYYVWGDEHDEIMDRKNEWPDE